MASRSVCEARKKERRGCVKRKNCECREGALRQKKNLVCVEEEDAKGSSLKLA